MGRRAGGQVGRPAGRQAGRRAGRQAGFAPYGTKGGMRMLAVIMVGASLLLLLVLGAVVSARDRGHAATFLYIIGAIGLVVTAVLVSLAHKARKV